MKVDLPNSGLHVCALLTLDQGPPLLLTNADQVRIPFSFPFLQINIGSLNRGVMCNEQLIL